MRVGGVTVAAVVGVAEARRCGAVGGHVVGRSGRLQVAPAQLQLVTRRYVPVCASADIEVTRPVRSRVCSGISCGDHGQCRTPPVS